MKKVKTGGLDTKNRRGDVSEREGINGRFLSTRSDLYTSSIEKAEFEERGR